MTRPKDEDDFLGRWSRRKAEARHAQPEPDPEPAPEPAEPRSDAEILEELGLPEPESLGPGSDFSAFMKAAVPDHLRRRALRRLWGTNPVLANLDQLVDYGEDYTDKATVVANLQTAWKAGRGYYDKLAAEKEAEEAAAREREAEARPPDEPVAEPSDAPAEPGEPEPESVTASADTAVADGGPPPRASAYSPRTSVPRRMRFDFGDA